jgi:hypothetical protein
VEGGQEEMKSAKLLRRIQAIQKRILARFMTMRGQGMRELLL